MPNTNSAKKRLRQAEKAHVRNQAMATRVKSARRKFMKTAEGEDQDAGREAYTEYCSVLDKAAKQGVIQKNTAIRRKTRAANMLRAKA
jgi:small subunit ribosomal protein S20